MVSAVLIDEAAAWQSLMLASRGFLCARIAPDYRNSANSAAFQLNYVLCCNSADSNYRDCDASAYFRESFPDQRCRHPILTLSRNRTDSLQGNLPVSLSFNRLLHCLYPKLRLFYCLRESPVRLLRTGLTDPHELRHCRTKCRVDIVINHKRHAVSPADF